MTEKKRRGRPVKKNKKKAYGTRLPPHLIAWLKSQKQPATKLIETALVALKEKIEEYEK